MSQAKGQLQGRGVVPLFNGHNGLPGHTCGICQLLLPSEQFRPRIGCDGFEARWLGPFDPDTMESELAVTLVREPVVVDRLPRELPTMATRLAASGYRTAWIGKWHETQCVLSVPDHGPLWLRGRVSSWQRTQESGV